MMRLAAFVFAAFLAQDNGASKPSLGLETRYPTMDEGKQFGLLNDGAGRWRGQVVVSLVKGGPAETAGLQVGDVILQLNENKLYSYDDVLDFVATSKSGAKVVALVKRAKTMKEEDIAVTMGARKPTAEEAKTPRVTWDFAGLAQLEAALQSAKKQGKPLLLGLSGSET